MPKRTDIKKILIIGSGPIIISQACEFDYSGTQACKALKEEGYEVVLINSNPATIMTDPEMADRTYIEPITPEMVCQDHRAGTPRRPPPHPGRPDRPQLRHGRGRNGDPGEVRRGDDRGQSRVIKKAEDRELFRDAMAKIGLECPKSVIVRTLEEAVDVGRDHRLSRHHPPQLHPGRHRRRHRLQPGGIGSSWPPQGLDASMITEVMLEESVLGWKEFELEVMRDFKDNVVIICSIENFDPMGVHTGDSITVAPAQTLTDREYQAMRDAAIAIIREIGVETGGSNIQFAINPDNGEMVVIEMNPRVSRSSALASKATGFPIAKIAAKLAVGYTLDEIPNDITRRPSPPSSPPSTTAWSRSPAGPSRNSPGPKISSPPP